MFQEWLKAILCDIVGAMSLDYLYRGLLILITLSGWGKVLYDYLSGRPKIRGQVFQVMRGTMPHPEKPGHHLSTFVIYVYIINQRKNLIHILDYELEIKVRKKWHRLLRVYGIHRIENLNFRDSAGVEIKIANFSNNLIYRKGRPVDFGVPLHGWIVFAGDPSLYDAEVQEYKLTCIDAFRHRHCISTNPKQFANLYLLQDIADIEIPKSAQHDKL